MGLRLLDGGCYTIRTTCAGLVIGLRHSGRGVVVGMNFQVGFVGLVDKWGYGVWGSGFPFSKNWKWEDCGVMKRDEGI